MNGSALVPTMSADEARALTEQARASLENARAILLRIWESGGYMSLGYTTWEAYAQQEFSIGRSHAYRMVSAGKFERDSIGIPVGTMPESYLRAIMMVLKEHDALDLAPDVHSYILEAGDVGTLQCINAAKHVLVRERLLNDLPALHKRHAIGEVSDSTAYHIALVHQRNPHMRTVLNQCTDGELATMLETLHQQGSAIYTEITVTLAIPNGATQVPLSQANSTHLKAYFVSETAEYRARAYEEYRTEAEHRKQQLAEVLRIARQAVTHCTCGATHQLSLALKGYTDEQQ